MGTADVFVVWCGEECPHPQATDDDGWKDCQVAGRGSGVRGATVGNLDLSADTLTGSTRKFFEILGKLLLRCWIFGFLLVFIRSRSDGRPDFPAQQQPMIIAQHVGRKPPESSGPGSPYCAQGGRASDGNSVTRSPSNLQPSRQEMGRICLPVFGQLDTADVHGEHGTDLRAKDQAISGA
jgi:hypothetical protein